MSLRPPTKSPSHLHTHVIFVHGLNGDNLEYWQVGDPPTFWPDWLAEDIEGTAVWSLGYPAAASKWQSSSAMALPDRATNILPELLDEPRLQQGNIIFVCHSQGGLVIEETLRLMDDRAGSDRRCEDFIRRVRRVAFLGSPFRGAGIASGLVVLGRVLPFRWHESVHGLVRFDSHLRQLLAWYVTFITTNKVESLVLRETLALPGWKGLFGPVVKADSADPGFPPPHLIVPLDLDHDGLRQATSRRHPVYERLVSFVRRPMEGAHQRSAIIERIDGVGQALSQELGDVSADVKKLVAAIEMSTFDKSSVRNNDNAVVTAEAEKRVWAVRRSRFAVGYDTALEARRLHKDLTEGELLKAQRDVRRVALAWCARVLSATDPDEAARFLNDADMLGAGDENVIAAAFIVAHRSGDTEAALAKIAPLTSSMARSASLIIATHNKPAEVSVDWFAKTTWDFDDLDGDGKFLLEQKRIEAGLIEDCLADAELVSEQDFEQTPMLLATVAAVNLAVALPEEFRPAVFAHQRFEIDDIILRGDATSMAHRRRAQKLYERAEQHFRSIGIPALADIAADYALWLGLLDPAGKVAARSQLEASMSDTRHALRRLPMALQFGIDIDLEEAERQIEAATAVSGSSSLEAAIGRFALARTKKAGDLATYIGTHREQLTQYYTAEFILSVEIQALAKSGQVPVGRLKLGELAKAGVSEAAVSGLTRLLDEVEGADPVALREAQFHETGTLPDLMNLVEALKKQEDWTRLIPFAEALVERAATVPNATLYSEALYRDGRHEDVLRIAEKYPEFLDASQTLKSIVAWSHYQLGHLKEAKEFAALLGGADRENALNLRANISIASGDWNAVNTVVEEEWAARESRNATELVQAGLLAQHIGSARSRDLITAAARMAPDNPEVLVACYNAATNSGWEDSSEIFQWLNAAIELSDENGPVQKFDLQQLLDMQPDWNEREGKAWEAIAAGSTPLFAAAHVLNQSLLGLFLTPALANLAERDPRRRGLVLAFSGVRRDVSIESTTSIVLDPTALLTLSFLGQLQTVIDEFERAVIPHTTLSWLLTEKQKIAVGQPSRVRAAQDLRRAVDAGLLTIFDGPTGIDGDLDRDVGADLAELLVAAKEATGASQQHLVVRPYPVHRPSSLMKETADLTRYEDCIVGTWEIVAALGAHGQLTAAEEKEATAYLEHHEPRWSNPPVIRKGAVLYLDGLAVTYLQHLGLLERLKAAGFAPIISKSDVSSADGLIRYSAFSAATQEAIELIRATLSSGIESGKVRLGASKEPPAEYTLALAQHPTNSLFHLAATADALVVDDRFFNQHAWFDIGTEKKVPILTSMDLIKHLVAKGRLDSSQHLDLLAKLRRAGFGLVPFASDELVSLLTLAPILDDQLVETAELKAIRESLLRLRMTDAVQLPQEHVWFDGFLVAFTRALRAQWNGEDTVMAARLKSNWIVGLFDIRGWAHRMAPDGFNPAARYRAQLLMLMMLPEAPEELREAYWSWLTDVVLNPIRQQSPGLFEDLVAGVSEHIASAVEHAGTLEEPAE
jgi:hypothetical protein